MENREQTCVAGVDWKTEGNVQEVTLEETQ